jgi:uncharacterized protein YkwD
MRFRTYLWFTTYIRTAFVVITAALSLVPAAAAGSQATTATQSERALLGAVNGVRTTHGLRPLRVDTALVRAARSYSARLISTDTFTHGAMGTRLAQHGARGPVFGENLAWGVGSRATASAIVRGWMASPGHRANLLRPGWNRIGLGALRGTFQGHRGATVVTADFAGR